MKSNRRTVRLSASRRSPHGERGLKLTALKNKIVKIESLSSWRAWIEMPVASRASHALRSRSPHGERGLKYREHPNWGALASRSPHGERGLKWLWALAARAARSSLSSWRAWIEMEADAKNLLRLIRRSPHGERGLKYGRQQWVSPRSRRSPHGERGLKWKNCSRWFCRKYVALLMESVD